MNRRILFFGFCLALGSSCQAEWIQYDASETADFYIDSSSVVKKGNVASYRAALNFRQRITPAISSITSYDLDCRARRIRFRKAEYFTELFGGGIKTGQMTPASLGQDPQAFFPLDSPQLQRQFDVVCSLKRR